MAAQYGVTSGRDASSRAAAHRLTSD